MAQTLAQKLASVQTAIAAIESGAQSVSVTGLSYSKGNLKDLYEREARIERQIAKQSNNGRTVAVY